MHEEIGTIDSGCMISEKKKKQDNARYVHMIYCTRIQCTVYCIDRDLYFTLRKTMELSRFKIHNAPFDSYMQKKLHICSAENFLGSLMPMCIG